MYYSLLHLSTGHEIFMKIQSESPANDERIFISALIRLQGISQGAAADAAGIYRQNMSAWMNGRDSATSVEKRIALKDVLGIRYGRLKANTVHRWRVTDPNDVKVVLSNLEEFDVDMWQVKLGHLPYSDSAILDIRHRHPDGENYPSESAWVILYRPILANQPKELTPKSIGINRRRGELFVSAEDWSEWLKSDSNPIEYFEHFCDGIVDDSDTENQPDGFVDQEAQMASMQPTQKELSTWTDLLLRAKMTGQKFDDIVKKTEHSLKVQILVSNKHPTPNKGKKLKD